jgi:hypothetical protein
MLEDEMKTITKFLVVLAVLANLSLVIVGEAWFYTTRTLDRARTFGVYPSAKEGMQALVEKGYVGIHEVVIHASTNSFDGSNPHIWFATARVSADKRADGSSLGQSGYDFPGVFFLHAKDGWVFVGEGYFPEIVGFWMKVFDLAG